MKAILQLVIKILLKLTEAAIINGTVDKVSAVDLVTDLGRLKQEVNRLRM